MEEFRLQYPLTEGSLVLDAGVFRGDFIDWCRKRWGCTVIGFEPARAFHEQSARRFAGDDRVTVHPYGLGARTERRTLAIQGDATSVYFDPRAPDTEDVSLRDVAEVFKELGPSEVHLFKINIEGGEYELLPRLLDSDLATRVRFFQVQYHDLGAGPDGSAAARDRIRARLSATHREEWCVNGGQWESWARR